jgi:hypothetical protein
VISMIWDQTAFGNALAVGPGGGARPNPDKPVNASRLAVSVGGHKVYGAYFEGGMGCAFGRPARAPPECDARARTAHGLTHTRPLQTLCPWAKQIAVRSVGARASLSPFPP